MNQEKTGKMIAGLRKDRGMTQEELGDKVGVSNKTVSRWENGNYMPDIEMLGTLADLFGVSIHELLAGEKIDSDEGFRKQADETILSMAAKAKKTAKIRKRGAILAAGGIGAYILFVIAVFVFAFLSEGMPIGVLIVLLILPAVVLGCLIAVLYERMKEIDKGEQDEALHY